MQFPRKKSRWHPARTGIPGNRSAGGNGGPARTETQVLPVFPALPLSLPPAVLVVAVAVLPLMLLSLKTDALFPKIEGAIEIVNRRGFLLLTTLFPCLARQSWLGRRGFLPLATRFLAF